MFFSVVFNLTTKSFNQHFNIAFIKLCFIVTMTVQQMIRVTKKDLI
jgi:hypothetical protein